MKQLHFLMILRAYFLQTNKAGREMNKTNALYKISDSADKRIYFGLFSLNSSFSLYSTISETSQCKIWQNRGESIEE